MFAAKEYRVLMLKPLFCKLLQRVPAIYVCSSWARFFQGGLIMRSNRARMGLGDALLEMLMHLRCTLTAEWS